MVPIAFFDQVAKFTKKYCYEDWVVEKFGKDSDGTTKNLRHFSKHPRSWAVVSTWAAVIKPTRKLRSFLSYLTSSCVGLLLPL